MIKRIYNRLLWETGKIPMIRRRQERRHMDAWMAAGKPGPTPHPMKQANLRRLARMFDIPVFVETGTCRADMLYALRDDFDELHSVELSAELCEYSRRRCSAYPHIEIRQGDSATEMAGICAALSGRVLFWLDGHYSGGDTARGDVVSPIIAELDAILACPEIEPLIVIDDARLFKPGTGYPTLSEMMQYFKDWPQPMNASVHDDAIVVLPDAMIFQSPALASVAGEAI